MNGQTTVAGNDVYSEVFYRREITDAEAAILQKGIDLDLARKQNDMRFNVGKPNGVLLDRVVPDTSLPSEARVFATNNSAMEPLATITGIDPTGGTQFQTVRS